MQRLKDKVAIITGGAKGLGKAYAVAMAGQGARVIIADIADGARLAADIGGMFVETDVANAAAASACARMALERFGSIDILVNNAALYAALPMARYDEIEPDLWDRVMAVNVRGAFNMIRAVAPSMEQQQRGRIINITSGITYKGMPGMLHYSASKGALVAMTRSLSRELGDSNITVNSLSPGLILSDSIRQNQDHLEQNTDRVLASRALKRHGYPEDLVGALLFLAGDDSAFITGQTIVVDGGSVNS